MIATDDTIAAIATARGGQRGIVRLSGPGTHAVLNRVLGHHDPGTGQGRSTINLNSVGSRDTGAAALPVCVLSFRAPKSYTGQDSAEILTVGNAPVLERVLSALLGAGARLATPGEFSARAYLGGKLTLGQAEGISARIAAHRDEDLRAADRVRCGEFGDRCAAWADRIARVLALVEAGIDFTDQEDVVAIGTAELRGELGSLRSALGAVVGGDRISERMALVPTAVLVGPPNAGKSTLFNALVGRERAVVSDLAGTTRDAIAEEIDLSSIGAGGLAVVLVDLPGLDADVGGPADSADASAQIAARDAIASADLLIACDPAGRFDGVAHDADRPVVRVMTKADLGGEPDSGGAMSVCAIDGWHLEALRQAIADHASRGSGGDAVIPRHRRSFANAIVALDEALATIGTAERLDEPEAIAASLRAALDEIGSVAGQIPPDEVLGRVFASFCVGK